MQREEIFQYVKNQYGTEPEYLWKDNPDAAVLRHHPSNKWYAILMKVPGEKLGLDEKTLADNFIRRFGKGCTGIGLP